MAVYTQVILSPDPLYLQPKSYDARSDRKWFADLASPGIIGSGDYAVTATSGNMNISIAAGVAWILGQNISDQGMYREYISAAQTMTVPNNASGNPRIDQVIIRIMDNSADGSTFNEPRIEIVPGTPTAGADLTNLNGAANLATLGELSKSVLRLCYVLVPNGAAVLTTAGNIKDARVRALIGKGGMLLGNLWTFASTPPASPIDGDVWIYTGISGQYWKFVYDSSEATYKWKFVGGPPVFAEVTGTGTITSGVYTNPPNGPDITLARAGIYDFRIGFSMATVTAGQGPFYMSYNIGATGASDTDAALVQLNGQSPSATVYRERRNTVASAGSTITSKYKAAGGTTSVVQARTMYITPVQVI